MTDKTRKEALQGMREELARLVEQRNKLDERITLLNRTIPAMAALCEEGAGSAAMYEAAAIGLGGDGEDRGLSDAIRDMISSNVFGATSTTDIRDRLVSEGWNPDQYANFLTVIHNTLRRLEKQGEVRMLRGPVLNGWVYSSPQKVRIAAPNPPGLPRVGLPKPPGRTDKK